MHHSNLHRPPGLSEAIFRMPHLLGRMELISIPWITCRFGWLRWSVNLLDFEVKSHQMIEMTPLRTAEPTSDRGPGNRRSRAMLKYESMLCEDLHSRAIKADSQYNSRGLFLGRGERTAIGLLGYVVRRHSYPCDRAPSAMIPLYIYYAPSNREYNRGGQAPIAADTKTRALKVFSPASAGPHEPHSYYAQHRRLFTTHNPTTMHVSGCPLVCKL